jgi:putative hydroxymethylpyrimidine transport system permease protein
MRHGVPGALRGLVALAGLVAIWQAIVWLTDAPRFILPGPGLVARTWIDTWPAIQPHALVTLSEIVLGMLCGISLGIATALLLAAAPPARRWLLPVLIASQAMPVFALAPILTLWLGFGMAGKIVMATLIIYFPVTTAFYDGLRRTEPGFLDLARVMGASGASRMVRVQAMAALPALASGLRVAAAVAPIGAVVGEWVGASEGLGYLMLHANGRSQTDLMFASLFTLAAMALAVWFLTDRAARALVPWQPDLITRD